MPSNYKYKVPKVFNHTQSIPSLVWDITLPFTGLPVVDVLVDTGVAELTKIMPNSVVMVSDRQVQITFTTAYSGEARVVA